MKKSHGSVFFAFLIASLSVMVLMSLLAYQEPRSAYALAGKAVTDNKQIDWKNNNQPPHFIAPPSINDDASESIDLRTQNAKVFQYSDGSGYAVVYLQPIHFQDVDGKWQEFVDLPRDRHSNFNTTITTSSSVITSTDSMYIAEGEPNRSNCDGEQISIGYKGIEEERTRSFLKFSSLPAIPAGSIIDEATLSLRQISVSLTHTARIYRVTTPWTCQPNKTHPTWNEPPGIDFGQLYAESWITPSVISTKLFNVKSLIADWYLGMPNHGLALVSDQEKSAEASFCSVNLCTEWYDQPHIIIRFSFPKPPTLLEINNLDGDDNYTVRWTNELIPLNAYYELEVSESPLFSPTSTITKVFPPAHSKTITDQNLGRWYYRVRIATDVDSGERWSHIRSVDVPIIITGTVKDGEGNPLSDVPVFSNSGHYTVTDVQGDYEFRVVDSGVYSFTPSVSLAFCHPTHTLTIDISEPTANYPDKDFKCVLAPQNVAILGATIEPIITGRHYYFTATVYPTRSLSATYTYTWQIGDSPVFTRQDGISNPISITWPITNALTKDQILSTLKEPITEVLNITVTVSNIAGMVTDVHKIAFVDDEPDDFGEPNDTCAQAYPISIGDGSPITPSLSHSQDLDIYQLNIVQEYTTIALTLTVPISHRAKVSLAPLPCNVQGLPLRPNLTPLRPNLTGEDNLTTTHMIFNVGNYTGTFFVIVESLDEIWSLMTYTLAISTDVEPPPLQGETCSSVPLPIENKDEKYLHNSRHDCYAGQAPPFTQLVFTLTSGLDLRMDLSTTITYPAAETDHYIREIDNNVAREGQRVLKYNVGPITTTYTLHVYADEEETNIADPYKLEVITTEVSMNDSITTVILFNPSALLRSYPSYETEIITLSKKLSSLAGSEVITVDQNISVNRAFEKWVIQNPKRANDVSRAIRNLFLAKAGGYPNLKYIVIIGDDQSIPHYRIEDHSYFLVEEKKYGIHVNPDTAIGAALQKGYFLSDDFYGDINPLYEGKRELFIPDYAIGRLIGSPITITNFINDFLDQKGKVDVDRGLVIGAGGSAEWDKFLIDSSEQISDDMETSFTTIETLIGDWDYESFIEAIKKPLPTLAALNVHANHGQIGVPANDDSLLKVITSEAIRMNLMAATGSAFSTIGCHAGLYALYDEIGGIGLPFIFSSQSINWIANTGFGVGGDDFAYSEQLMVLLNQALVEDDQKEIGIALQEAKQNYYIQQVNSRFDSTDEKTVNQLILYGLPMYVLQTGSSGESQPDNQPMMSSNTIEIAPNLFKQSQTYNFTVELIENDPVGKYYRAIVANGTGTSVRNEYPIQGLAIQENISETVHGVVFRGGEYTNHEGFDPNVTRLSNITQIWDGAIENTSDLWIDEKVFTGTAWLSSQLPRLRFLPTLDGLHQDLLIQISQFRGSDEKQLVYNQMELDLYSPSIVTNDFIAPDIDNNVQAILNRNTNMVDVAVRAKDDLGVQTVVVAYTSIPDEDNKLGSWSSIELTQNSTDTSLWTGSIPATVNAYFVQAVDTSGNVSVKDGNGEYFVPNSPALTKIVEERGEQQLVLLMGSLANRVERGIDIQNEHEEFTLTVQPNGDILVTAFYTTQVITRHVDVIVANAGTGDDSVSLHSSTVPFTIPIRFWGGSGNDKLIGGDGHDEIYGGLGNDILLGGIGEDIIDGGPGDDVIEGGEGNDMLYGDWGHNRVKPDKDLINGGIGDDYIEGNGDSDNIDGGDDQDDMIGGSAISSTIDAGDVMTGGSGGDVMLGDNGTIGRFLASAGLWLTDTHTGDVIRDIQLFNVKYRTSSETPQANGSDLMLGGDGRDFMFGQGNSLVDQDFDSRFSEDPLDGFDNDRDGRESDQSGGFDCLDGFDNDGDNLADGDDPDCMARIDEDGGGDEMHGGAGDDYMEGNDGSDWIFGGEGEDDIIGGSSTGDGHIGSDVSPIDLYDGHDVIDGGAEDDVIIADDGSIRRRFTQDGYWLTLQSDRYDIVVRETVMLDDPSQYGVFGHDYVLGGDGDDDLYGQLGDDYLDGGAGDDVLVGDLGRTSKLIEDGGREDVIEIRSAGLKEAIHISGSLYSLVELYAYEFDDGAVGNDVLLGGDGSDSVHGGAGDDMINGNRGEDHLFGGDGNDVMWGGTDHDHLWGGYGDDYLDVRPRPANGTWSSDPPEWFTYGSIDNYEDDDLIFGGWGQDALQANIGSRQSIEAGDRLIDWTGPYNRLYTCPGVKGSIIHEHSPFVILFLQRLGEADGALEVMHEGNSGFRELAMIFSGEFKQNSPPSHHPDGRKQFVCDTLSAPKVFVKVSLP